MATARPWYHFAQERVIAQSDDPDSPGIATTERDDDAALIVEAVNAYDALRAENARLRAALEAVEPMLATHHARCPDVGDVCHAHAIVQAALAGKEG